MIEPDTFGRKTVNIRRLDLFIAIAAQHIGGLLVAKNEDEIRS